MRDTPLRRLAAFIGIAWLLCVLIGALARADEVTVAPDASPVHVHSPATCKTDGGTDLRLPAGYFAPEAAWSTLDADLKRLGDSQTRLTAENTSLRASAAEHSYGWVWTGLIGAVVGVLVGALYL